MKISRLILASAFALGAVYGYAQEPAEVIEYDFVPSAYIQLQGGAQETLGEASFGDLISPNFQLSFGYQWNPLFGVRVGVNGLWSKGALKTEEFDKGVWKFSYAAPMADLTFDLTNAIGGFNPNRVYSIGIYAGVGANIAWDNAGAADKAWEIANSNPILINGPMCYAWQDTKVRLVGRAGLNVDFRLADNWKLGLEVNANMLNDKYNSKKAGNADWYFNGLVGVKYSFGKGYNKRVIPVVPPTVTEIVKETIVVHDTITVEAPAEVVVPVTTFERNVFFKINQSVIRPDEMTKVAEIANYMTEHPNTRVHITGYADKGTGTLAINLRLARQRAAAVVKALTTKYGIAADRITSSSMTESLFQPFEEPVKNRVAICVVE